MLTKIVCDTCHKTLRAGDAGAPTEHKKCLDCVLTTSERSNLKTIKKLRNTFEQEVKEIEEQETTPPSTTPEPNLKSITAEIKLEKDGDDWHLMMYVFDYYKRLLVKFGFKKQSLREFISLIEDEEEEEANKK